MSRAMLLALVATLHVGCKGSEKSHAAGEQGKAAMAESTDAPEVSPSLSIPVTLDGRPVAPITAAMLKASEPDHQDDGKRAWRIGPLVGQLAPGTVVEALEESGIGITMRVPEAGDGAHPVLFLTRRGELTAAAMSPADPFPDYHGQGGRQHRPGDPRPRLLAPITELRIRQAAPSGMAGLQVQLPLAAPRPLGDREIRTLVSREVKGDTGQTRTIWPARDFVRAFTDDPEVSVVVVGDTSMTISDEHWADDRLEPIFQVNRRGSVKFVWRDADGAETAMDTVRNVRLVRFLDPALAPSRTLP